MTYSTISYYSSSWSPVHFHEICLAARVWYFNPESVSIVSLASDQVESCLGLWLESVQALYLLIQPLTAWSLKIKAMKLLSFQSGSLVWWYHHIMELHHHDFPQVPTEPLPYAAQALGKRHISGDLGRCQRKNCWSISLCCWLVEIQMRVPSEVYIYILYDPLCVCIIYMYVLVN